MDTKLLKQLAKGCDKEREFSNVVAIKGDKATITNGRMLIQWKHGQKIRSKKPLCITGDQIKKFKGEAKINKGKVVCDGKEYESDLRGEGAFPFDAVEKVMGDSIKEVNKKGRGKAHKVGLMVGTVKGLLKALPDDAVLTFLLPKSNEKAIYFKNETLGIDGLLMPCRIN